MHSRAVFAQSTTIASMLFPITLMHLIRSQKNSNHLTSFSASRNKKKSFEHFGVFKYSPKLFNTFIK
ncbi:hypothetical protein BpHYR1_004087 [Brachionus plicatilis]|uniref:Uncharacterized protein n=1 Tax=Brachionus plicatilis TaxID=10195 RepID=A0A3M7RN58_BRAPC|nr:hypothetical protein BpHYR1_004087 [Brachionus plicatilis]